MPSTWNAGPRDAKGQPGPYDAALVGTPVAYPEQPLEILRTLHSFDPCIACGVHGSVRRSANWRACKSCETDDDAGERVL
jgi:Ni,Fe-hydrogenase I large subunit